MATRIGMMLPGAVSLGAYEGGALAAVLKAVQASGGELVVDAMASASAGSMTALIASRALLCGADPIELMTQTWVVLPQLDRLVSDDLSAPLTMQNLIDTAHALLGPELVPDGPVRQTKPVRLSMALTMLGGLTYAMAHLRDPRDPQNADPETARTLLATTHVDFFTTQFQAGATMPDFLAALDGAMASGSTPVGFPPRLLNRDDAVATYEANGILHPAGKPFTFWYSDGGDLDNQPFGRLLDLIGQIDDGDDDRVIVMLDIQPAGQPTWEGTWFDPDPAHVPSWLSTLLHVDHVRSQQNMYDDLRRLEKTNRHIAWIKSVAATLESRVRPAAGDSFPAAVREAAAHVADEHREIRAAIHARAALTAAAGGLPDGNGTAAETGQPSPAGDLEDLLLEAAGLKGKREVIVEVISPENDPAVHLGADEQLSGEFLFHFGGFFDERYRQSDFALGYRNAHYWLSWWLQGRVSDPAAVLGAVQAGYDSLTWRNTEEGNASIKTLSIKEKVEGIDLLGHIGHVVEHDLLLDVAHTLPAHGLITGIERDLHLRHGHEHGAGGPPSS
ncbi:MAG TPA: hypothetical protein VEH29_09935 [Acidimicrobiales bacterium]|nr:hypothetical protein [Acidimicrobiales bacterium]